MLRSGDCMFIVKHSVGTICVSLHSSHCLLSCTHSALPLLHYIQAIRSQSCQEAWDRKVTEIVEWSDAGRRDWVHLVCLQKLIHCCPIPLFLQEIRQHCAHVAVVVAQRHWAAMFQSLPRPMYLDPCIINSQVHSSNLEIKILILEIYFGTQSFFVFSS